MMGGKEKFRVLLQSLRCSLGRTISLLFVYAVVVTLIGVLVIVFLGRLAGRIKATPLEFKYPGIPKS